jgi:hypothetical protein
MGATDKAAEVATTTVEALKQTPLVLALVIFNVLFMFLSVYAGVKTGQRWDAEVERMHELVTKMMTTCGPKQ